MCAALKHKAKEAVPKEAPIRLPPGVGASDPSSWPLLLAAVDEADDNNELRLLFEAGNSPRVEDYGLWRGDAEALELLTVVSLREALSTPLPLNWSMDARDFVPLNELRASLRLRALDYEQQGDLEAAMESLVVMPRLGALLKDGDVDMLGWMVGTSWMDAEDLLAFGLRHSEDVALQKQLLALLEPIQVRSNGLRAFSFDCRMTEALLSDPMSTMGYVDAALLHKIAPYDKDATVAWHRQFCRLSLEQIQKPWSQREELVAVSYWDDAGPERWLHNPMGRQIMDVDPSYHQRLQEREDRALVEFAALRALTALRAEQTPDLRDPLGGLFRIEDNELVSEHDGVFLSVDGQSLRWPIHQKP